MSLIIDTLNDNNDSNNDNDNDDNDNDNDDNDDNDNDDDDNYDNDNDDDNNDNNEKNNDNDNDNDDDNDDDTCICNQTLIPEKQRKTSYERRKERSTNKFNTIRKHIQYSSNGMNHDIPGMSGFELYFSINHTASVTPLAMYILATSPRSYGLNPW